jgi:hypothetical protein
MIIVPMQGKIKKTIRNFRYIIADGDNDYPVV